MLRSATRPAPAGLTAVVMEEVTGAGPDPAAPWEDDDGSGGGGWMGGMLPLLELLCPDADEGGCGGC